MWRSTIVLLLSLTATTGCGESPSGEHQGDVPPGFERRRYPARLVVEGGWARLDITGLGSLDGRVPDGEAPLSRKVVGRWGSGYATEDYPSSFIHTTTLELGAQGSATYREEEGSESLNAGGEIQTSMHTSKGPWEGSWEVTGKDTIEIVLLVPQG